MNPQLKAVVFKTARLKETLAFFTDRLGFAINESSLTHFVIFSEGVRVLFVASDDGEGPSVEFYLGQGLGGGLCVLEDPNQIKIVLC